MSSNCLYSTAQPSDSSGISFSFFFKLFFLVYYHMHSHACLCVVVFMLVNVHMYVPVCGYQRTITCAILQASCTFFETLIFPNLELREETTQTVPAGPRHPSVCAFVELRIQACAIPVLCLVWVFEVLAPAD